MHALLQLAKNGLNKVVMEDYSAYFRWSCYCTEQLVLNEFIYTSYYLPSLCNFPLC